MRVYKHAWAVDYDAYLQQHILVVGGNEKPGAYHLFLPQETISNDGEQDDLIHW